MNCVYYIVMLLIVLLFAVFIECLNLRKKKLQEEIIKQEQKVYKASNVLKKIKKEKQQNLNVKIEKCIKGSRISFRLAIFFVIGAIIIPFFPKLLLLWKNDEEERSQSVMEEIFLEARGKKIISDPAQIVREKSLKAIVEGILSDKLFFSWYKESAKATTGRRQFYKTQVNKLLDGQGGQAFMVNENGTQVDEADYNENISELNKIENEKVPKGYSREDVEKGIIKPRALCADQYLREYKLRWECYRMRPEISMLQQLAKAAEDATVKLSEDVGRKAEMVESAGNAITHYLCLIRFEGAGESKADCCYWIAKVFSILSEHLPKEFDEMIEHCKLMSYAFCEKGVNYLDTLKERNHHEDKLRELFDTMDVKTAQYAQ